MADKRDKYFVYHSGVDKFYMRSNSDEMQREGEKATYFAPERYA